MPKRSRFQPLFFSTIGNTVSSVVRGTTVDFTMTVCSPSLDLKALPIDDDADLM